MCGKRVLMIDLSDLKDILTGVASASGPAVTVYEPLQALVGALVSGVSFLRTMWIFSSALRQYLFPRPPKPLEPFVQSKT
jgi:hypothetical protein